MQGLTPFDSCLLCSGVSSSTSVSLEVLKFLVEAHPEPGGLHLQSSQKKQYLLLKAVRNRLIPIEVIRYLLRIVLEDYEIGRWRPVMDQRIEGLEGIREEGESYERRPKLKEQVQGILEATEKYHQLVAEVLPNLELAVWKSRGWSEDREQRRQGRVLCRAEEIVRNVANYL